MVPGITLHHIASILRAAAAEAERLASEASLDRLDWIDQSASPLGSRRHCAAVRARMAQGLPGAAVVGRRHLLSPEAVRETVESMGRTIEPPSGSTSGESKLRNALRLVGSDLWDE